jgi:hypothetical protein
MNFAPSPLSFLSCTLCWWPCLPTITYVEPATHPAESGRFAARGSFCLGERRKCQDSSERSCGADWTFSAAGMPMEVVGRQELVTLCVLLLRTGAGVGRVGISIDSKPQYPFLTSLQGWSNSRPGGMITVQLIRDIGRMITGKQKVEVSGPIGIVQIVGETVRLRSCPT